MKSYLALLALGFQFLAWNAEGVELTKTFHFDKPVVVQSSGGVLLKIRGCRNIGDTGNPMLPVYAACFFIPTGERVDSIEVKADEGQKIAEGLNVIPMPAQLPLGSLPQEQPAAKSNVYKSTEPFPEIQARLETVQRMSGLKFAFVDIFPCQLIPASGEVIFHKEISVTIKTSLEPSTERIEKTNLSKASISRISRIVENPEDLQNIPSKNTLKSGFEESDIIPYVIITNAEMAPAFENLSELKKLQGLNSEIFRVSWIDSSYSGADIQEKIRNFITYAYNNWKTRYVLLGGDEEIIPHRGLYAKVGTEIESDICSDLYYGALDGNWNSDGDSYYGEPGEEDLLPEVIVGRLPADNAAEAENSISKILSYSQNPVKGQCTKAALLGELLWTIDGENTWGGDYKDEIATGSANYGFETAGLPSYFSTTKLYERDIGFPWNETQVLPILNSGVNLVNHIGHSNQFMVMQITDSDVSLITNDGINNQYFIVYSQGCYAASFDNRDVDGNYYGEDAIAEQLITSPTGTVAFIGNSRLGWDAPGSTCGVSQFFDRQFFDALFGEEISILGDAFEDSRFDDLAFISYPAVRYTYYEMNILGDPAMPVWTKEPLPLEAAYDSVLAEGQSTFEVHVTGNGEPISGANTSLLSSSSQIISTARTDVNGLAVLAVSNPPSDKLVLTISAPNYYPVVDTIPITDASAPLPSILSMIIDDDSTGATKGDGDGHPEPSELIGLNIVLRNGGDLTLNSGEMRLISSDEYIAVVDSIYDIGKIYPGSWLIAQDALSFEVSPDIPSGHSISFDIAITSNDNEWIFPYEIPASAPACELASWSVADTIDGDGDGCIEAWEFINVDCTIENSGSIDILSPTVTLSAIDSSWAKVNKGSITLSKIPAGDSVTIDGNNLEFFIRENTPVFSRIRMRLSISGENIQTIADTLTIQTCGYGLNDSIEPGTISAWNHHSIVGFDCWHLSSSDYHSPPFSWKFGDTAQADYYNMTDNVLETPPMCLAGTSTLSFWHRMEAEASSSYPYWANDAGVVEISTDNGLSWSIITPTTGYPCRASGSNTIFLAPYARCYSGTINWREETFDLSPYSGPVRIRFHFSSDEQYGYEGWYIDDVVLTTEHITGIDDNPPGAGPMNALGGAYPNPFNPSTIIPFEIAVKDRVSIQIFDVLGRRVKTILDKTMAAGKHNVIWNGKNDSGRPMPSGVYFIRFKCGIYSANERIVLVR